MSIAKRVLENDINDLFKPKEEDQAAAQDWISARYPVLWELFQREPFGPKKAPDFGISIAWTGHNWRVRIGVKSRSAYAFTSISVLNELWDELETRLLERQIDWRFDD